MKSNLLLNFLVLFLVVVNAGCSQAENTPVTANKVKKVSNVTNKVKVHLGANNYLTWNSATDELVKDSLYFSYQNDMQKIKFLATAVGSEQDLDLKICSKTNGDLKVGDVAFLYLLENQNIQLFSCLGIQFDILTDGCKYPVNLLDHIQANRKAVQGAVERYVK